MTAVRVVLGAGALFSPRALDALPPGKPVVLPVVAFLERSKQLSRQGRMAPSGYRLLVEQSGWIIEPFDATLAVRSPAHNVAEASWKRLARDAIIASHRQGADEMWTANPVDFVKLGVPAGRIVDVADR